MTEESYSNSEIHGRRIQGVVSGEVLTPLQLVPSDESWKRLMGLAIRGNGQFPQAFFAQGVHLARGIVEQSQQEGLPLLSYFQSDPSPELIHTEVRDARNRFHGAYKIETTPVSSIPLEEQYENVWRSDKRSAETILMGLGRTFYKARGIDPGTLTNTDILSVTNDPLFYDILTYTEDALLSDKVKRFAKAYKERMAEFIHKYAPYTFLDVPPSYQEEQKDLMRLLYGNLDLAIGVVKDKVVEKLAQYHPNQHRLIAAFEDADQDDLFGEPRVTTIHPLKDPDD